MIENLKVEDFELLFYIWYPQLTLTELAHVLFHRITCISSILSMFPFPSPVHNSCDKLYFTKAFLLKYFGSGFFSYAKTCLMGLKVKKENKLAQRRNPLFRHSAVNLLLRCCTLCPRPSESPSYALPLRSALTQLAVGCVCLFCMLHCFL